MASDLHACRAATDSTPNRQTVGWCSTSTAWSRVLLVQLRSGAESSETAGVLSGDSWWTATRTATAAGSNPGLTYVMGQPPGDRHHARTASGRRAGGSYVPGAGPGLAGETSRGRRGAGRAAEANGGEPPKNMPAWGGETRTLARLLKGCLVAAASGI